MESVAARTESWWPRIVGRIDGTALSIWALAGGLVLYLAIDGGGYDVVVHSQVGVIVWWIVLVGAAWGLLPAGRPARVGWAALALFGAFVAWTALAFTWSQSSERSLSDLSLVAGYLGVLVLGVALHRDRDSAIRHTIAALGTAIVIVAALALASRLRPGLFHEATQTSSLLQGTKDRLAWPLNYWNALAALLVLGLPLLLALATSGRRLLTQAAAGAAIPLVVLCGYLTFSRGGALAAAVALLAFIALAPERFPKLATILTAAAGSAVLIAGVVHRPAIEHGLTGAVARHQGAELILPIVLVCCGVALAQVGIGLAARHGTPPALLVVSRRRAQILLAGGIAVIVVAGLLAGGAGKLSHAWRDFKHPTANALHDYSIGRFGAVSGNGRYDYWKAGVNATGGHLLAGSGPGTFQLLWLPRAPYYSYVQNAHSLYVETLAELGIVGLALLVGFFALVLWSAVALVVRLRYESRTRAAGAAAALLAFMVSAAFDWIWQVPALPVAFLVLAAAVLAPRVRSSASDIAPPARLVLRVGAIVLALACLVAIAVPLATTSALRASQASASNGDPARALRDAQQAARIEPGAASPQLQLALVQELQGNVGAALVAARRATRDEPRNWTAWLIESRLEAEAGNPRSSLAAFRRARSLNPRSPLFANARRA
jgi:O-Antigen ligase